MEGTDERGHGSGCKRCQQDGAVRKHNAIISKICDGCVCDVVVQAVGCC